MANFNFNKTILGGRLTADPELKKTQSGISVVSFSLAVNRREKSESGERIADFFNVTAWRGTAEFICSYFKKGSNICVVGSLQNDSWNDEQGNKRYRTIIMAYEAYFCDARTDAVGETYTSNAENATQGAYTAASGVPGVPNFEVLQDDEELPF